MNLFCGMETGELKRHEIIMSSAKENPKFMGAKSKWGEHVVYNQMRSFCPFRNSLFSFMLKIC